MMNTLIFFHGVIRIKAKGEQTERFLNLCSAKNICLWDICYMDKTLYAYMDRRDFHNIKSIVKKTNCKVSVIERKGVPFLWRNCGKHKVYLFGFLVAVLTLCMSFLFIWNIRISGNKMITQDMFKDLLDEQAIHVGMLSYKLKTEELEKSIRNTFDRFIWVNVKKKGWTLYIEVKENTSNESLLEQSVTGDLISPYNGRIHSIMTRSGVPKVNKGMEVEQGQVLVEGAVPIPDEEGKLKELLYVRADADIELEHTITWENVLQKNYVKKEYTGRKIKIPYLKFGEKKIELPIKNRYKSSDQLVYTNTILEFDRKDPLLGWGLICHSEFLNTEHFYSFEEAKQIFYEKITLFLETLQEKGVQILQKDVKIETYDDCWKMQLSLSVIEHIGEEGFVTYNMSESKYLEETENLR